MERFDRYAADHEAVPVTNGHVKPEPESQTEIKLEKFSDDAPKPATGMKRPSESDKEEDISEARSRSPPKKKRKAEVDEDAAFAARLQAEENSRARPTRGAAVRKPPPVKKKKTPKKKTSSKVHADDDSELDEEGSGTERKVNRNTGFHVRNLYELLWRY